MEMAHTISAFFCAPAFCGPAFCLRFMGTFQMSSSEHWNFCHIAVNRQTTISSHRSPSTFGALDTLLVPSRITRLAIFPGFMSSINFYNWATVAARNAIPMVVHDVLRLCITLTRLSHKTRCEVARGDCCMFHTDSLKHALESVSGTLRKLFLI